MDNLFLFLLTIGVTHYLALASPGPDFFLVLRHSLEGSRRAGVAAAFGIMAGIAVHLTICLVGIATVVQRHPLLLQMVSLLGAGYLAWIGWGALRWKPSPEASEQARAIKTSRAFRDGLICNLLNPKATLFFWSLFAAMITSETPLSWQLMAGGMMMGIEIVWFSFVAWAVTLGPVRARLERVQQHMMRATGVILLLLAALVIVDVAAKLF